MLSFYMFDCSVPVGYGFVYLCAKEEFEMLGSCVTHGTSHLEIVVAGLPSTRPRYNCAVAALNMK